MGEGRKWSVEAKEFEILIKGGLSGIRIVEKRNSRRRSICVQRDEILWLVGAVETAANVDTSEVFWDQSRAGYIRLIVQRRANRHGRFLTIEEYEGRRRSGSVLIPEGWSGQGWHRLIAELGLACSSLKVGRGFRLDKAERATVGQRSFAEVVGATKRTENHGSQHLEPFAGVGVITGVKPASEDDRRGKVTTSTQSVPETLQTPVQTGGSLQQSSTPSVKNQALGGAGDIHRSTEIAPGHQQDVTVIPRGSSQGVACQGSKSRVKGRRETSFNAKLELGELRVWLSQLRSEIDAGLVKVDVALKKLENDGPGQVKKRAVWIQKTKPRKKLKPIDKRPILNGVGVGLDPGPTGMNIIRKTRAHADGSGPVAGPSALITKPMVLTEEEGAHVGLGLTEGPGHHVGLGRPERVNRMGSMKDPGGGGDPSAGATEPSGMVQNRIRRKLRRRRGLGGRGNVARSRRRGVLSTPSYKRWSGQRRGVGLELSGAIVVWCVGRRARGLQEGPGLVPCTLGRMWVRQMW
jgi:hypothetical protein